MGKNAIHELKKKLDGIVEGNGKSEEIETFLAQETDEPDEESLEVARPGSAVKKFILWGVVFFFCAAAAFAWLGYALFNPYNKKTPSDSVVLVADPQESDVSAGSDVIHTLSYVNQEKNPISDLVLIIEYPTGFSLKETSLTPKNTQKNYWEIGTLKGGERGELVIRGALMGRKDETKNFSATLYYRPTSMNTQFIVKKSWSARISSQPVTFDGPSEVIVGDPVAYTVSYSDLRGVGGGVATILHIDIPQSFLVREIIPKPDGGANSWTLETLVKNMDQAAQSGTIKISGEYQEGTKGTIGLRVSLESPNGETKTSSDLALFQTKVNEGEQKNKDDLSVKLAVNNSSNDLPITPGSALQYVIAVEHTGRVPVKDATVQVQFKNFSSGSVIGQWTAGSMSGESRDVRDATVQWTSKDVPDFSLINPGEKFDVNFQLYTPKKVDASAGILEAVAIVSGMKYDPKEQDPQKDIQVLISSNAIKSPMNSDFALLLDPVIFDNDLVAEKPKTYRVEWTVTNSIHELKDLKISARVPSAISWLGNTSVTAGEIAFNKTSRQTLWTLNRLPVSVEKVLISFDLQLTPTDNDLKRADACASRKPLPLLSKITASATDSVTQSTIVSEQTMVIQGPPLEECKKE